MQLHKQVYDAYIEANKDIKKTARTLNNLGLTTVRGNKFTRSSAGHVLRNAYPELFPRKVPRKNSPQKPENKKALIEDILSSNLSDESKIRVLSALVSLNEIKAKQTKEI